MPLRGLFELWVAYYWTFVDPARPIYQGAQASRDEGPQRNDLSFRPALTRLRHTWQELLGPLHAGQPADGYFLLTECARHAPGPIRPRWRRPTTRPWRPSGPP